MLVSLSANTKKQTPVLKSDSCSAECLDTVMPEITYSFELHEPILFSLSHLKVSVPCDHEY